MSSVGVGARSGGDGYPKRKGASRGAGRAWGGEKKGGRRVKNAPRWRKKGAGREIKKRGAAAEKAGRVSREAGIVSPLRKPKNRPS